MKNESEDGRHFKVTTERADTEELIDLTESDEDEDEIYLTEDVLAFLEATENANHEISPIFMQKSDSPSKEIPEKDDKSVDESHMTENANKTDFVEKTVSLKCTECNKSCTNEYEFQCHQEDHRMCKDMAMPNLVPQEYVQTLVGKRALEAPKSKD